MLANDEIALECAGYRLRLAPGIGGSIASLTHNGTPILRGSDSLASPLDAGCFPLVPYCNRIRNGQFVFRERRITIAQNMAGDPSPLHGDGWLHPWDIVEQSATHAVLAYDHSAGEWPWAYQARQSFQLSESGLEAEISCTNRSDEAMPCGLGFHPYFPCDAETMIETDVEQVWEVDEIVLPTVTAPATGHYSLAGTSACARGLDNGYGGWGGEMRLIDGGHKTIRMTSPDAGFFQIYSPAEGGFLAAEPVSHANAALNEPESAWAALGLRVIEPGETMRLRMFLSMTR